MYSGADDLVARFENLNLSSLSDKSKRDWKAFGDKVFNLLPLLKRDATRGIYLEVDFYEVERVLGKLKRLKNRAQMDEELALVDATKPIEDMLQRVVDLGRAVSELKAGCEVFSQVLDEV